MRNFLLLLSLFFLSSACTKSVVKEDKSPSVFAVPPFPAINSPEGYKVFPIQLTEKGENREARYSPDGTKIIYSSYGRREHLNAQIYMMDLRTRKETRITHQVGNTIHPSYHTKQDIILYSSSTDEIKEDLSEALTEKRKRLTWQYFLPFSNETIPTEVYMSHSDGSQIQRLTTQKGFDGDAEFHPHGNKIIFTSKTPQGWEIMQMDLHGKEKHKLLTSSHFDSMAQYSLDGRQITWVKKNKDPQISTTEVWMAGANMEKPHTVVLKAATYLYPSLSPNGQVLLFSSNRDGNFEIYALELKENCLKRLTWQEGDDLNAVFHPDSKKILFSSQRRGTFQVYEMNYEPPQGCEVP